jgi:Sec23-binding domain of Sec16
MDKGQVKQKVEALLVLGKRKEAVEEAIASKDFATALFLADACDPETSHRTKLVFAQNAFKSSSPINTVAMLFSGALQASDAVGSSFQWGVSPNELKMSWKRHLAGIISNRVAGWDTIVVSLGDRLREIGEVSAAHFCYVVCGCPVASPWEEGTRLSLIGCTHSNMAGRALCSLDSIEAFDRTEAYEWAKRRGNKNATLKSFQPFKIVCAARLIDAGLMDLAKAYVDSLRAHSNLHDADVDPNCPSTLAEIFQSRASQEGALRLLESKLGLQDVVAPSSTELLHYRRNASPVFDAVRGGHFEEGGEDVAIADQDVTFMSAKSNLMDKTGFTLTPDKSPCRPSKHSSLPSSKFPTVQESMRGTIALPPTQASKADVTSRHASLPARPVVVNDLPTNRVPSPSLGTSFNPAPPNRAPLPLPGSPREIAPKKDRAPSPSPATTLMTPGSLEHAASTMTTPQPMSQRPKAAPSTAPSVLMGKKVANAKDGPSRAPASSGKSKLHLSGQEPCIFILGF